jgi:hypothetical protein
MRGWLQGEPTLEDVFSDSTVHAMMERDEVNPDDLRMFLEDVRRGLEGQRGRQSTWDRSPRHAPANPFSVTPMRTPELHPRAREGHGATDAREGQGVTSATNSPRGGHEVW